MKLYSYWRSTASYRVRVGLHLKGIPFETIPVNLFDGEQFAEPFRSLVPSASVPALAFEDGTVLTQSLAILDYLENIEPEPPLLPAEPMLRARVLAASQLIAADIHPVNNLSVVNRLKRAFGAGTEQTVEWMRHWMTDGFRALQSILPDDTPFTFSDRPLLSDICLVAQFYNAHRWGVDLAPFSRLTEIETRCLALPAFVAAHPESQPDAALTP